jgi:hypothetical protein
MLERAKAAVCREDPDQVHDYWPPLCPSPQEQSEDCLWSSSIDESLHMMLSNSNRLLEMVWEVPMAHYRMHSDRFPF